MSHLNRFTSSVLVFMLACSGKDADRPTPQRSDDAGSSAVADAGTAARALATLESASGTVTVTRQGATAPATKGPLFDGDVIETHAASKATLTFTDGRVVELGENGRLEVNTEGDGLVLTIGQGVVVSKLEGGAAGGELELSFETPYGLVRGGRGLTLDVGQTEASIDVTTGDATIVSRQGGTISLTIGEGGTLSSAGATRKLTLEPLVIILSQGTGRIELKRKDTKAFVPMNPKKQQALGPGDTLRVTQGSATITPDKSDAKLTLLSGTEVGIGESTRVQGAEEVSLEMKKGQLQLALPFGAKRTVRPGDGVTLVAEQGGQLSLVKGKNGLELNSIVGDVTVTTEGGQATRVKGGQTATISKAGVEARDVNREALVIPSRSGQRLVHPGPERVSIVWPGDDSKAYRFKMGPESSLEKPTVDGVLHQTYFNTLAPQRGVMFWKVYDGEQEVAKGSLSCAPEKLSDELGGITNEVPAGPDKTVIYFQDKPPALTFTWKKPEKPVAEYQLKVYTAGALSAPIQERRVPGTSAQVGGLPEGAYQWDVTWLDEKGTPIGTAGKMNQLELHYDNAVKSLLIKSPRNGDPLTPKVNVLGVAPIGVKVSVNGQAIGLDAKGRFSGQVAPLPGGRVVFRFLQDGAETVVVRWLGRGGAR